MPFSEGVPLEDREDYKAGVAAEREACAKLVEEFEDFEYLEIRGTGSIISGRDSMGKLSKLIRTRGK